MTITLEQREELHLAIRDWTIDADRDIDVGNKIIVSDATIKQLRGRRYAFVLGKKGTGKTGLAKALCERLPKKFRVDSFADLYDEYRFILQRLSGELDFNTMVLAFEGAILRRAIKKLEKGELPEAKQLSAEARTRILTEPSWLDKIMFFLSRSKISKDGIEAAMPETGQAAPKIAPVILKDRIEDVLKLLISKKVPEVFFFDSVDEAAQFRITNPEKSLELKALIHAVYRLHQRQKGPAFVLLLRPDYLQVTEDDLMRKCSEQSSSSNGRVKSFETSFNIGWYLSKSSFVTLSPKAFPICFKRKRKDRTISFYI